MVMNGNSRVRINTEDFITANGFYGQALKELRKFAYVNEVRIRRSCGIPIFYRIIKDSLTKRFIERDLYDDSCIRVACSIAV
jgi:hypothetical protein